MIFLNLFVLNQYRCLEIGRRESKESQRELLTLYTMLKSMASLLQFAKMSFYKYMEFLEIELQGYVSYYCRIEHLSI